MPGRITSERVESPPEAEGLPVIAVSSQPIISIEHPCIIRNLDRGISSLGGEFAINKAFEGGKNPKRFEASFRPDDVLAKALTSKKVDVKQLLLKVTVPRRTGRRRKRGSNGPFEVDDSHADNDNNGHVSRGVPRSEAKAVLRAMRDNQDDYSVEVAGKIGEAHRFRNLPDFQYATSGNSLMQNLRESIFAKDLASVRDFKFDMSMDLPADQDVGPPPFFAIVKQPYNWSYKQNPYVKSFRDAEGNLRVINTTVPIKHIRHNIDPNAPFVPSHPPAEITPIETTPAKIQTAVKQLRQMFEKRPLMQRRVFVNLFVGRQSENELKAAVGYCGYTFTSGPWRDTVIKFGIDPRKDPKYRIYQTVTYQLQNEPGVAADDPGSLIRKVAGKRITVKQARVMHSHIFDGEKFYKDGKVWQACDVTDGVLKDLLDNAELRSEPDMVFSGWYGNGTWALFRRIMRYKIQLLSAGRKPNDELCSAVVCMFPCFVDDSNVHLTRIDEPGSFLSKSKHFDYKIEGEAAALAAEVRATAMAAHRYRDKTDRGRIRRSVSVVSGMSGISMDTIDRAVAKDAKEGKEGKKKRIPESPNMTAVDESDAGLLGLDSESEGGDGENSDEDAGEDEEEE